MTTITLDITEVEYLALGYAAHSPEEWVSNLVRVRAGEAIDEIVQITVAKCLETSTPIPNSKDEMVALAFAQGWVKSAADRQALRDEIRELEA